jgi:type VI secretion system protein ImpL
MIKKFFAFLLHPILLTVIALLIIATLVWWIGPLVAIGSWTPLVSELSRYILIGVIVLLVILRMALGRWRARRASHQLTDGLMKAPAAKERRAKNSQHAFCGSCRLAAQNALARGW